MSTSTKVMIFFLIAKGDILKEEHFSIKLKKSHDSAKFVIL